MNYLKSKMLVRTSVLGVTSLLLFASKVQAQKKTVSGTVTSEGKPLGDVNIYLKGKSVQVLSDSVGSYSIPAEVGDTLVFDKITFGKILRVIGSANEISVSLLPEAAMAGDEVVVVGYTSQKKETVTGSISVLKGSEMAKTPQANVSNSIAGRVSGVVINNRGGEPGYDGSNILIRGMATTGSNDVLVVVDGVPGQIGGLQRLNPQDIESMSILKDASAAIYGSRAANGVILITTKRGKTGKPRIDFSLNQGYNSPTRLPKMADAATYAAISNEIAYYNYKDGGLNQIYTDAEIQKFRDGSDPLNYPNTDWAKATLRGSVPQTQSNISVRGGSENVKYFVSMGYLNQDGLYKNGATNYKQYSFRSNIDAKINDRLSVSLYLSGREEDRNYPVASAGDIFRSIYRAYPTVAAIYPNGLPSYGVEGSNPVVMATDQGGTTRNPQQVFNGILKATYKIPGVDGLTLDGFVGIDRSWNFSKSFAKPYQLYTYDPASDGYTSVVVGGSNGAATLSESNVNQIQVTSNARLNYNKSFGRHSISTFVGIEQSEIRSETFGAYRRNFPTITTPELSQGGTASTDQTNYGSSYHYTRRSYIGKASYNYAEKYLFDLQMRIDGSSAFPSNERYGYFPSVSAGWVISKEKFFHVDAVDNLKLRASYGLLGNDNIDLFQYLNTYGITSQLVLNGVIVPTIDLTKLANPNIHWETAKKLDIAVNANFLRDFDFEFIYFQQKRANILTTRNQSIANVTGIVNPSGGTLVPDENIGKVNSHGVEATLGYNKRSPIFAWGVSGNFTYAANKIEFIDEAAAVLPYQSQTGHPLNTYLLYNAKGIFRTNDDLNNNPHLSANQLGDLIYDDYNGDGQITADDMVRTKYSNVPQITYGITLNASYKNAVDLAMVFAGQTRVNQYILPESGNVGNFYNTWADNRWSPTNVNGSFPRVDTRASSSINGGQYKNSFWLQDASFLRLKSVELGYSFSSHILEKLKLDRARLYVSAFNLFTLTKMKDYDPEGSSESGQFYPQQKIVNIGINVSF